MNELRGDAFRDAGVAAECLRALWIRDDPAAPVDVDAESKRQIAFELLATRLLVDLRRPG